MYFHSLPCSLLPSCMLAISNSPKSVYRISDMLTALMRRNNHAWKMNSIAKVRHQVRAAAVSLGQEIEEGRSIDRIYPSVIAVTANLTHVLILLMEV